MTRYLMLPFFLLLLSKNYAVNLPLPLQSNERFRLALSGQLILFDRQITGERLSLQRLSPFMGKTSLYFLTYSVVGNRHRNVTHFMLRLNSFALFLTDNNPSHTDILTGRSVTYNKALSLEVTPAIRHQLRQPQSLSFVSPITGRLVHIDPRTLQSLRFFINALGH
jgi:hypothetical protein